MISRDKLHVTAKEWHQKSVNLQSRITSVPALKRRSVTNCAIFRQSLRQVTEHTVKAKFWRPAYPKVYSIWLSFHQTSSVLTLQILFWGKLKGFCWPKRRNLSKPTQKLPNVYEDTRIRERYVQGSPRKLKQMRKEMKPSKRVLRSWPKAESLENENAKSLKRFKEASMWAWMWRGFRWIKLQAGSTTICSQKA